MPINVIFFLASGLNNYANGADIFVSEGPDGSPSYSSSRLNKSYRMVLRDASPKPAQRQAARIAAASGNTQVARSDRSAIASLADQLAQKHQLEPALVKAVIDVESNANPAAVSIKGATGAMQLMPATAAMYGVTRLDDPEQNIEAGILHLKRMLKLHNGNLALALAAYNAGEGAVAKNARHIPPYRETMLYVPAVLARLQAARDLAAR
jgi:soluble lytic murein transglycosylase-like protein